MIRTDEQLVKDLNLSESEIKFINLDVLNWAIDKVEREYSGIMRPWHKLSGKSSYNDLREQVIVWIREGTPHKGMVIVDGGEFIHITGYGPAGFGRKKICEFKQTVIPIIRYSAESNRLESIKKYVNFYKKENLKNANRD